MNYDTMDLRSILYLIETSDNKSPEVNSLGTTETIFSKEADGHIPKNIRYKKFI